MMRLNGSATACILHLRDQIVFASDAHFSNQDFKFQCGITVGCVYVLEVCSFLTLSVRTFLRLISVTCS